MGKKESRYLGHIIASHSGSEGVERDIDDLSNSSLLSSRQLSALNFFTALFLSSFFPSLETRVSRLAALVNKKDC